MNDPTAPLRTCDIVMKGGITSGVVYPQAITALARRFRLVNIGGTSAGAIAAAIAAAAEHRRQAGGGADMAGFDFLDQLPGLLGETVGAKGRTRLFGFFQPSRRTRRLFDVATAALEGGAGAAIRVLQALSVHYAPALLLGLSPGLLLGWVSFRHTASPLAWLWLGLGLGVALVGAALAAALALLRDLARELPRNGYGLCSGLSDPRPGDAPPDTEPLTEWLAAYLDRTAGLPADAGPLTFGHLWNTRDSDAGRAPRRVNLEMMTTNLTHGRPYRIPFRDDEDLHENNRFYFRRDEFERLFPKRIIEWMIAHPREKDEWSDPVRRARLAVLGYHPFPAPADLPVVVATRMSLSFPVLLAAVPLHAIDRSEFAKNDQPERCWFSDGGICSNFPLHFFDTALPRRPTFSIDLVAKKPGASPEELRPEMDQTNRDFVFNERWNRFDTAIPSRAGELPAAKPGHLGFLGFFGAIVGTMQNWTDTTQARLPGYRDRIVRVPLTPEEGGLNLAMPPERIQALTERGVAAAGQLLDHFDEPARHPVMTWENHRWIRLRAYLASLEKSLVQLERACDEPENGDIPYELWLAELHGVGGPRAPSYAMTKGQLRSASETLAKLRELRALWSDKSAAENAPHPRPALRPRPQI